MLDLLRNTLPTPVLAGLLAALLLAVYGLAALWAVGGRGGWLVRIAPLALLLAALVPLGAYDLVVQFGTQAVVVIGWVLAGRFVRAYRDSRRSGESRRGAWRAGWKQLWSGRPRFRLRDLLTAVLLAAGILAIVRYATPWYTVPLVARSVVWSTWLVGFVGLGAIAGIVTIAVEWMTFGRAGWQFRVPVMLLCAIAIGGWLASHDTVTLPAALASSVTIVAMMMVARATDWAFWRRETNAEPTASRGDESRSWMRRLSRGVACATGLLALAILIPMYRALLPPAVPEVALPDPNGYDELVRAAKSLNWSAIPTQDYEVASAATRRRFVKDNPGLLAAVREALAKPCQVPIDYDAAYFNSGFLPDIQVLRSLSRALVAIATVARDEGRHADAAEIYADLVGVGDAESRGGLLVQELVGFAISGMGMHGLVPELSQLDAAELATLCESLERADSSQERMEQILAREEIFGTVSLGWTYRMLSLMGSDLLEPATQAATAAETRYDAHLRLILAEAAVRRYELEHGSAPESLDALVPEYLAEVPQDPYGEGPLVYRRTTDGYLLYSVGGNGTDDGGERVRYIEATVQGKGDFFFDADPNEPPAAAPAKPAGGK